MRSFKAPTLDWLTSTSAPRTCCSETISTATLRPGCLTRRLPPLDAEQGQNGRNPFRGICHRSLQWTPTKVSPIVNPSRRTLASRAQTAAWSRLREDEARGNSARVNGCCSPPATSRIVSDTIRTSIAFSCKSTLTAQEAVITDPL